MHVLSMDDGKDPNKEEKKPRCISSFKAVSFFFGKRQKLKHPLRIMVYSALIFSLSNVYITRLQ